VGDRGGFDLSPPVETGDDTVTLEARARGWIEPYWNAKHLVRTRDWLLELDPEASEALRLAAMTHDMERHFPGGPVQNLAVWPEDEGEYRRLHSERSAQIVGEWLRQQGAHNGLIADVERLIVAHEIGGAPDEDLVQAADSLSFLEVNPAVLAGWYTSGRAEKPRARAQAQWMYERIRLARAQEVARPLLDEALGVVDRA
jgi:hypothetical protein